MLTLDQIIPIKDQVLVIPDPVKTVSDGGIHIPETVNANNPNYYTMTGVVVKTGAGRIEDGQRVPVQVQAGDRIVFGRYSGKQIELEDRSRVLMMRESDVIGLADTDYVQPGYQAPAFSRVKGTARPGEAGYVAPANMVQR